jgi:tetratricopeptide (TPR) repeat protein
MKVKKLIGGMGFQPMLAARSIQTMRVSRCSLLVPFLLFSCVTGCGGGGAKGPTKVGDVELSQELSTARASFTRGAFTQAANLYRLALKRAEVMDDPSEIANAAYNYAAAELQIGEYDKARSALHEATTEAARAAAPTTDITSLESLVAYLQGKPDEAAALASGVLSDKKSQSEDRLQATLVQGQIACDRKDALAAQSSVEQAKKLIGTGVTPTFAAGIAELEARIAVLQQNYPVAAERFDKQADFLRQGKLYGDMVRALARAGDAYAEANQPAPAADRYYRAGRSALAQNGTINPRPLLEKAATQAEKSNDAALADRVAEIRKTMPTTVPAK